MKYYHIAHPNVACEIVGDPANGWVPVKFAEPVTFEMAIGISPRDHWLVNPKLLFKTTQAAIDAHDPNWRSKYTGWNED